MTPRLGIEPGTHWRKASTLTTMPTLLPAKKQSEKSQCPSTWTDFACKQKTFADKTLAVCGVNNIKINVVLVVLDNKRKSNIHQVEQTI